jgi:tripartite-type tricarboxylate transporter receptor subunit TctC
MPRLQEELGQTVTIDNRPGAGGNFVHVPYKGGAPLAQALMAGEVPWGVLGTADARGIVQSGKLKVIGLLHNGRSLL